jgi:poly(ADP-ribose) glycohydrolase
MVYYLPNKTVEWVNFSKNLLDFADGVTSNTEGDDFQALLVHIYRYFTGLDKTDKFDDVPAMLRLVNVDVGSRFLNTTLPAMLRSLVDWIPQGFSSVPFLSSGIAGSISLTASQVFHLISMSFLCIPLIDEKGANSMRYGTCCLMYVNRPKQVAKLTCLMNYFNIYIACQLGQCEPHLTRQITSRNIEFVRIVCDETHGAEWWCDQTSVSLSPMTILPMGEAIESVPNAVHADFANKHIGGGVLRRGAVQEEIRMIISPESLVAVFLSDPMQPNEAVLIRNTIRFNAYAGYSQSFRCSGISEEIIESMQNGQECIPLEEIICMDAIPFGADNSRQFSLPCILRELEKCRIALSSDQISAPKFATGNWGCGVFGGDPQLKAVIQWLAASVAGKEVVYCPFDNHALDRFPELVEASAGGSVASVLQALVRAVTHNQLEPGNTVSLLTGILGNT